MAEDLAAMTSLHVKCSASGNTEKGGQQLPRLLNPDLRASKACWLDHILDGTLLVGERQGAIIALASVRLEKCRISDLILDPEAAESDLLKALLAAIERLAVGFGILDLQVTLQTTQSELIKSLGYGVRVSKPGSQLACLSRSLRRRQTRFGRQVSEIGIKLGIPGDYPQKHRVALQTEANHLRSIGKDVFGREQRMTPMSANAWKRLVKNAMTDGVILQAVSAWRSVSYQQELVQRKIGKGQKMQDILRVSAAPGYSEHHTGRAIDITTPGYAVLEEDFENSRAFAWLMEEAAEFGFRLSFPRNNRNKLAYEPWHWCYKGRSVQRS